MTLLWRSKTFVSEIVTATIFSFFASLDARNEKPRSLGFAPKFILPPPPPPSSPRMFVSKVDGRRVFLFQSSLFSIALEKGLKIWEIRGEMESRSLRRKKRREKSLFTRWRRLEHIRARVGRAVEGGEPSIFHSRDGIRSYE